MLISDSLRHSVLHTESLYLGRWGIGRDDYVVEPELNAHQLEMNRMVDGLQRAPQFRVGSSGTMLDFSFTVSSAGEHCFTDVVVQLLDAHSSLWNTLAHRLDRVTVERTRPYIPFA